MHGPSLPSDGLLGRLKSHKVIEWTLAYAAAAYTLLHGVEMLSEAQEWPHILVRVLSLVLVLGAPIVATVAWYHGARGLKRVSGPELAILTVLLFLAGSVLWYFARSAGHTEQTADIKTSPVLDKSIAVLPFTNLSSSADDEYLSDGLADTLLQMLSNVSDLKVIARTSSFSFKGKNEDVRAIGQKLGVASLLVGSVQHAGDQLRVLAQLVSTKDGTQLWTKTYDRKMADVFTVQDEIAAQVAAALTGRLRETRTKTQQQHQPPLAAYEAYLRGRQLLRAFNDQAFQAAGVQFRAAIELDPAYAQAYAGLAESYVLHNGGFGAPGMTAISQAQSAVQRALELDPELADAYVALGLIRRISEDRLGAAQAFQRAIDLNPGSASAYLWQGWAQLNVGNNDEAKQLLDRAAALDPESPTIQVVRGAVAFSEGRAEAALQLLRRALELEPQFVAAYYYLGLNYEAMGRLDDAGRNYKRALALGGATPAIMSLVTVYGYLGDDATARKYLSLGHIEPGDTNTWGLVMQTQAEGDDATVAREASRVVALSPKVSWAVNALARTQVAAGHASDAVALIRSSYPELMSNLRRFDPETLAVVPVLALALTGDRRSEEAQLLLQNAEKAISSQGMQRSWFRFTLDLLLPRVLVLQGKKAEALSALRTAIQDGDGSTVRIWSRDPEFASIRDTPEFKQCVESAKARNAKQLESLRRQPELAPT